MNQVIVKNQIIGEGIPKICVSIVGKTKQEILEQAKDIKRTPADLIEWRADWFLEVKDIEKVLDTLRELSNLLAEQPVLFTFRSKDEGGVCALEKEAYRLLNHAVVKSRFVDLIDVELFMGEDTVEELVKAAHQEGVKVVASNHDFDKTPTGDEIIRRLCRMQELGADILKIAVMPRSKKDLLVLLCATLEMKETYANQPVVTMSMGKLGLASRLLGETVGSAITFGALEKASAPGQLAVDPLHEILQQIHKGME